MSSEKQIFSADAVPDLTGKVVLITGGAAGLGLETTYLLLRRNATVYVASRNESRAQSGIDEIVRRLDDENCTTRGQIHFHHCDLSSISSAAASAREFLSKSDQLDILIANAGLNMTLFNDEYTGPDGYEPMFATNHLGHVALIITLLPVLKHTASLTHNVRIVMLGSMAMYLGGRPDYSTLKQPSSADSNPGALWPLIYGYTRYGRSKLAMWYFTKELHKRLRDGTLGWELEERPVEGIYVNCCHPGTVGYTGMGHQVSSIIPDWLVSFLRAAVAFFGPTPLEGAMTPTYLAVSPEIKLDDVGGKFYTNTQDWGFRYAGSKEKKVVWFCNDEEAAVKCWEWSLEVVREVLDRELEGEGEGEDDAKEGNKTEGEEGWETVRKSEGEEGGVRKRRPR